MNKRHGRLAVFLSTAILFTMACGLFAVPVPSDDPNWPVTAAAQTWSAMEAIAALSATPTFTQAPITDTPIPTSTLPNTPTATITNTPIPVITQRPTNTPTVTPTVTPVPTSTRVFWGGGGGGSSGGGGGGSGGGGVENIPCYDAEMVRHITVPNGTVLLPGTDFIKIWRVKNTGSCIWERGATMVAVSSDFLSATGIPLASRVRPGETVDVSMHLVVPAVTGTIQGRFELNVARRRNIGPGEDNYFRSSIISSNASGVVYNFVANACQAQWRNGQDRTLNCPSRQENERGFVRILNSRRLEDGNSYSPVLWTHPEMERNGVITGTYPALLIQNGDHLRFQVGCLSGNNQCDVEVEVSYRGLSGGRTAFFSQHQVSDGAVATFNQSLNSLAGSYVSFVIKVTSLSRPEQSAIGWVNFELVR